MPLTKHVEKHFTATETIRDIVIGMSDGLTVPFALAAGLTGAIAASSLVVTAGMAEVAAGSIAMGLGGYLAAQGDAEHFVSEKRREEDEVRDVPEKEALEVRHILEEYGLETAEAETVVTALRRHPDAWVDFMMRFELGLEEPDPKRAFKSAATIGLSYAVGGMIPLLPYFFIPKAREGLLWSAASTEVALLLFGGFKGRATGTAPVRSAFQTLLVGGVAAGVAFLIARLFSHGGG